MNTPHRYAKSKSTYANFTLNGTKTVHVRRPTTYQNYWELLGYYEPEGRGADTTIFEKYIQWYDRNLVTAMLLEYFRKIINARLKFSSLAISKKGVRWNIQSIIKKKQVFVYCIRWFNHLFMCNVCGAHRSVWVRVFINIYKKPKKYNYHNFL